MLDSIKSLLDNIASGQMTESKTDFDSIISEKLKDKLNDKRKYAMNSDCELDEASYSAKAARAGKDIGKPGKQFDVIAQKAAKQYGSEEAGKRVAGSVLAKLRKENEEDEELDTIDEISSSLANKVYQTRSKQLAKMHYSPTDKDSPEYKSLEAKQQKAAQLYTKKALSKPKPEAKSKEETDSDIQKQGSQFGGHY